MFNVTMKRLAVATLASVALFGCDKQGPEAEVVKRGNIQIVDLREGTGEMVTGGSRFSINFIGYIVDSAKTNILWTEDSSWVPFDSSFASRVFPYELGRNIIPGLDKGLDSMKVGGKRIVVIPAEDAFGEQGVPGIIPPNSTLRFVVELKEVSKPINVAKFTPVDSLTLPEGVVIRWQSKGTGAEIVDGDMVAAHYSGFITADGKLFDSSIDRKEPIRFTQGQGMIPGWVKAFYKLRQGDKAQIIIPSEMGYGPSGNGPIPPNSSLTFDVEVLEVTKAPAAPAAK